MKNMLFVAWRAESPTGGAWNPIGRLEHDGRVFRFCYTKGARNATDFHPFAAMEDLEQVYESDELFPVFANRLLPETRPEYEAFLKWGEFGGDEPPDPISILGVTEGIRQTDSIELFPCPIPDSSGCYLNKFFLHGLRYMPVAARQRVDQMQPGEELFLSLDIGNKFDRNAVSLHTNGSEVFLIGYVPRYLARDVWRIAGGCDPDFIDVTVARVNRDAPLQQRLLCKMRACWPDHFIPCSDEEFQPIPQQVLQSCVD
jgi:HIRAN domain